MASKTFPIQLWLFNQHLHRRHQLVWFTTALTGSLCTRKRCGAVAAAQTCARFHRPSAKLSCDCSFLRKCELQVDVRTLCVFVSALATHTPARQEMRMFFSSHLAKDIRGQKVQNVWDEKICEKIWVVWSTPNLQELKKKNPSHLILTSCFSS